MPDYLFFSRTTGIFLGYREDTDINSAFNSFCDEVIGTGFDITKMIIKTREECTGVFAIEAARHDIPWSLSRRATPNCQKIIGIEPHDAWQLIDVSPFLIYLSKGCADE